MNSNLQHEHLYQSRVDGSELLNSFHCFIIHELNLKCGKNYLLTDFREKKKLDFQLKKIPKALCGAGHPTEATKTEL